MKILLVTNYQPPHMGGIEFAGEALKDCWERDGHTVTWMTTDVPKGGRPATPRNIRVAAWNVFEEKFQINSPIIGPRSWRSILREIDAHDVVNTHSLAPGLAWAVMWMALRRRRPTVVTQHVGVIPLKLRALSALQQQVICRSARWAVSRGAPLTFVGAAVRDWFHEHAGLAPDRTFMTPAGINHADYPFVPAEERAALRAKWNLAASPFRVLFVGRFYDKKGLPLIEAAARALPDIAFTLVGGGPVDAAAWNLPNVRIVRFVKTEELRELYGAHDVFLMPSYGEGWPAVVPQAMACGLPCIISEECFTGYARDAERFTVVRRTHDDVTDAIRAAARRGPLPEQARRALAAYALDTWDWQRTARLYVDLFRKAGATA